MPSPRSIPFPLQGRTNLIFVCVRARSWCEGGSVPVGCALWGHAPNLCPLAHQIFPPSNALVVMVLRLHVARTATATPLPHLRADHLGPDPEPDRAPIQRRPRSGREAVATLIFKNT